MPVRKPLPPADHVARFVPYGRQHRHPDTDQLLGVLPTAMELDANDKGGLSVTWLEHFGPLGPLTKRLAAVAYRESLKSKHLGPKGLFASAQVSDILSAGLDFNKTLRVVHDPVDGNTGHAEVRQFTDEDLRLLDVLATEVFTDLDVIAELKLPKR